MEDRVGTPLGTLLHDEAHACKTCDTDVGGCGALNEVELSLARAPPAVFTMQLAWESQQESPEDIVNTLAGIPDGVRSWLACARRAAHNRPHDAAHGREKWRLARAKVSTDFSQGAEAGCFLLS